MTTDDHQYPSGTFSQTFQRFASQVFSLNDKDAVEPCQLHPLSPGRRRRDFEPRVRFGEGSRPDPRHADCEEDLLNMCMPMAP